MPRFKSGDTAWAARFHQNYPIQVPCSICAGTRKVILILGNGEQVELSCDYCGKGNFDIPTGVEVIYEPVSEPELIIINAVNVTTTNSKEDVEYHVGSNGGYRTYYEDTLFVNREEAAERGEQLKQEWLESERKRIDWLKKDAKKSFAWNAGYHLRQIKYHEKQIEYHKEKAQLCKERSKTNVTSET